MGWGMFVCMSICVCTREDGTGCDYEEIFHDLLRLKRWI
jgi:hypothetical protein